MRDRGLRFVLEKRGVSALKVLENAAPGNAIEAEDGSYSFEEAWFRARMLALSLRSRGLGEDWVGCWNGGRSRDWLVAMAGVGAAGGVWHEGLTDTGRVVFDEESITVAGQVCTMSELLTEGGILAGLGGLRHRWDVLWFVDGKPVHRFAPGPFVVLGSVRLDDRHRVGDLAGDFAAATLAYTHVLHGRTLVFEGDADAPALGVCGTARTGIATVMAVEEATDHPRSVGRALPEHEVWVIGPQGAILPVNEVGDVWVGHPDVVETAGVPEGFAPLGRRGSLDADGFLYLEHREDDLADDG